MVRTVPSALNTHIAGTTTSLCTLWEITREDGVIKRFTDLNEDVTFSGNTFKSAVGYQRSDISGSASLSVDSLDVQGILNSDEIDDGELRGGCYDHAYVKISQINWATPANGEVVLRVGWFGEIIYDEKTQSFQTELRGLTQAFAQEIVERYTRQCRYSIGDSRCNRDNLVPIWPDTIASATAYSVGDVVKVRQPVADVCVLHAPGSVDDDDDSQYAATGTTGSDAAAADTNKTKHLAGSFRFTPTGGPTQNPSNSFVSWPDSANYTIGLEPFTIEMWVNFDALDLVTAFSGPVLASHHQQTGNNRAWMIIVGDQNSSDPGLAFWYSTTGANLLPVAVPLSTFTPNINQWYHIAVTRDHRYKLRIFVDGVLKKSTSLPSDIYNSTDTLRLGMWNNAAGKNRHFEGSIEDFRFIVGDAVYTADFTPPSAGLASTYSDTLTFTEDYGDTLYSVVSAGTTATGINNFPVAYTTRAVTSATQIDVVATNKIRRLSGSFLSDGWQTDMIYRGSNFTDGTNNGNRRIQTVTASTITITSSTLVIETGTGDEALTHVAVNNIVNFSTRVANRVAGTVVEITSNSVFKIDSPSGAGSGGLASQVSFQNAGIETGDTTGWVVASGAVQIHTSATGKVHAGTYSIQVPDNWTGTNYATIQQTLDITDYASLVDAGGQTIKTSYWYWSSGGAGKIWVHYYFLDADSSTISTTTGTPNSDVLSRWIQFSQQNNIPVSTRSIVVNIRGGEGTAEPFLDDFTVSTSFADPNFPSDEFNYGVLTFDTGLNAGKSFEVKDYNGTSKEITLFLPTPFNITVGDKIGVHIGCNLELSRCIALGNQVNHGGFPTVPGDDEYGRYPDSPY